MKRIFVIADTHFYHRNIIKYTNRPFSNVGIMNSTIIDNWNNLVTDDDIIFHLGDVFFCGTDKQIEIMKQLKGHKILIRGNHDGTVTKSKRIGFAKVYDEYKLGDYMLTHRPLESVPNDKINIHGHVHNVVDNWLDGKHICVSVEMTDYLPVLIGGE